MRAGTPVRGGGGGGGGGRGSPSSACSRDVGCANGTIDVPAGLMVPAPVPDTVPAGANCPRPFATINMGGGVGGARDGAGAGTEPSVGVPASPDVPEAGAGAGADADADTKAPVSSDVVDADAEAGAEVVAIAESSVMSVRGNVYVGEGTMTRRPTLVPVPAELEVDVRGTSPDVPRRCRAVAQLSGIGTLVLAGRTWVCSE